MSNLQNTSPYRVVPVMPAEDHWVETLADGTPVLIRPLRAEDRDREIEFLRNLSAEARHFRFLCAIKEVSSALIDHLMDLDYERKMAFVALVHREGKLVEVGISRYAATEVAGECEFAVTIADGWHDIGLDSVLMGHLVDAARENGFTLMYSVDSAANVKMHALARRLGLRCQRDPQDASQLIHSLEL